MANEVVITIKGDDKASGALDNVKKSAGGLGSTLGEVGKIAGGFLAANVIQAGIGQFTSFIGGSKDAAVNLGESLNAVNVVFGSSAQKILDWGKNTASAYGLSNAAFNQLVTPLGAMLQNYGFSADDAADSSIELAKRAADMASVFNVDVSEALAAIQAGLRGEADPLEKFGVGLNAAAIEGKALAMTGKEVASALTDQEKKTAALALIMEQTDAVAGDFVNTSDSLANSERIAAAEAENQQAVIGNKLLPAYKLWSDAKLAATKFLVENLIPAIEATSEWLGPKIAAAVQFWKTDVEPIIKDVSAIIAEEWAKFQVYYEQDIKPALDNIIAATLAVIKVFEDNWPKIEKVVRPIMEQIALIVETQTKTILAILDILIQLLGGDFSGAWEAAKKVVELQIELIKGTVGNLVDFVLGLVPLLFEAGKAAMKGLGDGLVLLWNAEVKPFLMDLPNQGLAALGNLFGLFQVAGREIVRGIWQGVLDMKGWLLGKVEGLANDILGAIKNPLKIFSPSQRMADEVGKPIMEGIAEGMRDGVPRIIDAATDAMMDLKEIMRLHAQGLATDAEFLAAFTAAGQAAAGAFSGGSGGLNPGGAGTPNPGAPGGFGGTPVITPIDPGKTLGQVLNASEGQLLGSILGIDWQAYRDKSIDFVVRLANQFDPQRFFDLMYSAIAGMKGGGWSGAFWSSAGGFKQGAIDNFLGDLRAHGLLFDSGGWLPPGVSLAVNNTGKPERILGPQEMGGNTYVYAPTFSSASGPEAERFLQWIADGMRRQSLGAWA